MNGIFRFALCTTLLCVAGCGGSNGDEKDGGGHAGKDGGGSDDGGALNFVVSPAATRTVLKGKVVTEIGTPLAGAMVSVAGGGSMTTVADGSFSLGVTTGRAVVTISATGYVPRVRIVGITSVPAPLDVHLAKADAPQTVGSAGATVNVQAGVKLAIPAAAYASDASVSATWIDAAHLGSASARAQFQDADFVVHRFVGQLHIEASAQPSIPATLTVPVPSGASQITLSPLDATTGERGVALSPTSVSGGVATFAVPHFSDWIENAVVDSVDWIADAVTSYVDTSGNTQQANAGDPIPSGAQLAAGDILCRNVAAAPPAAIPTLAPAIDLYAVLGRKRLRCALGQQRPERKHLRGAPGQRRPKSPENVVASTTRSRR